MLNITDIRITKVEGDDKLKAFAALVIEDSFLVGDLRVVEGEDGYFVAMPSRRKRDGSFKDIAYPLNNTLREQIAPSAALSAVKRSKFGLICWASKNSDSPPKPTPEA